MPREAHIERQVQWKNKLQKFGFNVELERTLYIRNARVIVDVFAEFEGKKFLIEIGDIDDNRKSALMQFYAENNPKIEFIHEGYGEDKISVVLESVESYKESPEFAIVQERKMRLKKIEDRRNYFLKTWSSICFILIIICIGLTFQDSSYWCLVFVGIPIIFFIWLSIIMIVGKIFMYEEEMIVKESVQENISLNCSKY